MSLLIERDLLQILVETWNGTSLLEVLCGVVGKTLSVELILEVLESKSVIEDLAIIGSRLALLERSCCCQSSEGDSGDLGVHLA